jgi:hypothetical protein
VSEASAPAAWILSEGIASLLRLQVPRQDVPAGAADASLKLHECGGYLHRRWLAAGRLRDLPQGWAAGLARAHQKTMMDNLQALAEFRVVGRILAEEGVPFVLLKGGAYLIDLYDDPGERMMTDIDLLVRRADLGRLARRFASSGYEAVFADEEFRRFEVAAPNPNGCHFEFHWWLGLPLRVRISQEEVWSRSVPAVLEGVSCLRLAPEDALLYHVAHQADHYFGPSLKWTIDLRQMLRVWKPDPAGLLRRAADWRLRIALDLGLRHLDKLFPGVSPDALRDGAGVGALRGRLLRPFLASDPVQLFAPSPGWVSRYALRCLLIDRPMDALGQVLRVMVRPIANRIGRGARFDPPLDWSD